MVELVGTSRLLPQRLAIRPDLAMDVGAADGSVAAIGVTGPDGRRPELLILGGDVGTQTVELGSHEWADEWTQWGGLVADPRGGFLATGVTADVRVGPDGRVREEPLPDDTIALSATGDTDTLLVGLHRSDDGPESRKPSATGVYTFDRLRHERTPDPVTAFKVVGIVPSSTTLAFLQASDGAWHELNRDGRLRVVAGPTRATAMISPDGRLMAVEASRDQGPCVANDDCSVAVTELATRTAIADGPGPASSQISFGPSAAAYAYQGPSGPQIVILDATGEHRLNP